MSLKNQGVPTTLSFDSTLQTNVGGQQKVLTFDDEQRQLSSEILIQLRLMNTYLSLIWGEEYTVSDMEYITEDQE